MTNLSEKTLSPEERAKILLSQMTITEKIDQLRSQLSLEAPNPERDYTVGHVRTVGHFMHKHGNVKPSETATAINHDTEQSMKASRFGIPILQNCEALHGVQWCSGTCYPQAIGLAAMFDPDMVEKVASAVSEELRAGGIRQVFAPVVNVVRDCRWGRTEESYGEDVKLVSDTGCAYVRGLEKNNVIATPKHFVDNYSDGGRDSNESHSSWRELREVYLEPFRSCFIEGGARSTMLAYNSVDGVPCSMSKMLMQNILREEWGFKGFTVSDYCGVDGVYSAHQVARNLTEAQALCLKAGLDVDLPNGSSKLHEALKTGLITEEDIDRAVGRVLKTKFELGLFDNPFVDVKKADEIVHSPAHVALARESARKCMVLLKNEGLLPLTHNSYKRIGVFGPSANTINVGGYSGPYGGWKGEAKTPYEALCEQYKDTSEVVLCTSDDKSSSIADTCDLLLYFTATLEGEGADRSNLLLPGHKVKQQISEGGALIVEEKEEEIVTDQEMMLEMLSKKDIPLCVIMINGAPVDVSGWEKGADAILEAWYPGEQGAEAIVETLTGKNNPGGRLPITFPKCIGQVPLFYARKPTGRGFRYVENDGEPQWCFGFGMSYTTFEWSDFRIKHSGGATLDVTLTVKNTGTYDGDEVVQLYLSQTLCDVVRPMKEMKAYQRVHLSSGGSTTVSFKLNEHAFSYYNQMMEFGLHSSHNRIVLGANSKDEKFSFEFDIM